MDVAPQPFADLPAGLVAELLEKAGAAGTSMLGAFRQMRASRQRLRAELRERQLIAHESLLGYPPEPSTCGTDGSYGIERLLTADFVACAAVAVEGLTPPKETRYWPEPRHSTYVAIERHADDTATILRSIMVGREMMLARSAPHDLVMIDGSMAIPLIYLNQAISAASQSTDRQLSRLFLDEAHEYLASYLEVLRTSRTDKQFIALPKYTTRREIGRSLNWPEHEDDRGLLTLLLEPGEYTPPRPMEQPTQPWHLGVGRLKEQHGTAISDTAEAIAGALGDIHTSYYKPHVWLPALRLEMSREIATNPARLAIVVRGIKHQCATSSMLEPYPIYLADRTVKSLARALPAFRHIATQHVSEQYEGDIAEVFFAMHGYRSESGA